jgi:hypothetical protein
MYDKYSLVNRLPAANVNIPKHKGIIVSANTAALLSFNFYSDLGVTMTAGFTFSAGTSILPIQPHSLSASLPAGVTAFYLN